MFKFKKHSNSVFHKGVKTRLLFVSVLLTLFGAGLIIRLFYLQVVKHDYYVNLSEDQYLKKMPMDFERGEILDRNQNVLAANIDMKSVYVEPLKLLDPKKSAHAIASVLGLDSDEVIRKVSSTNRKILIQRKSPPAKMNQLKALGLPGVIFEKEQKRFYPKRELASQVLGFVGTENQGLAGAEYHYRKLLRGESSSTRVAIDGEGRTIRIPSSIYGQTGKIHDVVLTIDEVVQFIAEYHLKKQVEKHKARKGIAIVMEPHTGEIYAMASVPLFNPNNFGRDPKRWINHAIASAYEPGSIFKPILAAAALDAQIVDTHTQFDCENGRYKVGRKTIGEASNHKFGLLTVKDIIAKSSNIGSVKIAEKLGSRTYHDYIRRFGFGKKSGIDLSGEARGKVHPLAVWKEQSLASVSFGQEISVTPLQMITAISAIANGGNLMKPQITKALIRNDKIVKTFKPEAIRQVISQETSRKMIEIMEAVITDGTAEEAALKGFEVAGKTGTAQMTKEGVPGYIKDSYLASFVGFAPSKAPKLAILVMIDTPTEGGHYGGQVAAPAFREIAKETLRYMNVTSSKERVFILDHA